MTKYQSKIVAMLGKPEARLEEFGTTRDGNNVFRIPWAKSVMGITVDEIVQWRTVQCLLDADRIELASKVFHGKRYSGYFLKQEQSA